MTLNDIILKEKYIDFIKTLSDSIYDDISKVDCNNKELWIECVDISIEQMQECDKLMKEVFDMNPYELRNLNKYKICSRVFSVPHNKNSIKHGA